MWETPNKNKEMPNIVRKTEGWLDHSDWYKEAQPIFFRSEFGVEKWVCKDTINQLYNIAANGLLDVSLLLGKMTTFTIVFSFPVSFQL